MDFESNNSGLGIQIGFSIESYNSLNTKVKDLLAKVSKNNSLNLNIDQNQFSKLQAEFNKLKNSISNSNIRIFKDDDIEIQNKKIYTSLEEIKKAYSSLGENVKVTGVKSLEGELEKVVVSLEKAKGLTETINFSKVNIANNSEKGYFSGFTQDYTKVIDNTAKQEQMLADRIANGIEKANYNRLVESKKEASKATQQQIDDENKLIETMAKAREQSELNRKEQEKSLEYNQTKAINNTMDSEFNRISKLGSKVQTIDPSLFSKSNEEITEYIKNLYGADAKITGLTKNLKDMNTETIKMTVTTSDSNNMLQKETLILDKNSEAMYKNSESLKETSSNTKGLLDYLSSSMKGFLSFTVVMGGFYEAINKVKEAVTFTNDINKKSTNIEMVTGMSSSDMKNFIKDMSVFANELHTTTDSALSGAENFLRAGHTVSETVALLKASSIGSALSGQSNEEMSNELIAITNGFKMATDSAEDLTRVIDTLSQLDSLSATSMKEISLALTRTASSAQMAGVSFEDLSTYIAVVSSVTRKSSETIGNSFQTLFSRYQNVRAGKLVDDETGEALNDVEAVLNKLNIKMRDNVGQFKSFSEVIDELKSKWSGYSQVEQNAISTAMSGTRNRENFLVLMQNLDKVNELQGKIAEGAGSAKKKFDDVYGNSTESKLNELKNTWQQLYLAMFNSNIINVGIKGLTNIVTVLKTIAESSNASKIALAGVAASIATLSIAMIALGKNAQVSGFTALNTAISNIIPNIVSFATSGKILSTILNGLTTGMSALISPVGLISLALGAITLVVAKNIQQAKELKVVNDNVAQSYKDLTKAIQDNDVATMKLSSSNLSKVEKDLQDAMNQKAEAQKKIEELNSDSNKTVGRSQLTLNDSEINKYGNQVSQASQKIEQLTKILKDNGLAYDENTGKISELSKAQNLINYNEVADSIRRKTEAESNSRQTIVNMIDEYKTLNAIEDKNITQRVRMSQLANDLKFTIDGLVVSYDDQGNAIISNTDLLDKEVQTLNNEKNTIETLTNTKLYDAKKTSEFQYGSSKICYEEAKKRILMINEEIKANQKLAESKYTGDMVEDESIYKNLQKEVNQKQYLVDQLQKGINELDKIFETKTPTKVTSSDNGSGYTANTGGKEDDKTTKTYTSDNKLLSTQVDLIKQRENLLANQDDKISNISNSISELSDNETDLTEKLKLQNNLLDEQNNKTAMLRENGKLYGDEMLNIKEKLAQGGFFSYDELATEGWDSTENLNAKFNDLFGGIRDFADESAKESFESWRDTFKDLTDNYTKYSDAIITNNKNITSSVKDSIKTENERLSIIKSQIQAKLESQKSLDEQNLEIEKTKELNKVKQEQEKVEKDLADIKERVSDIVGESYDKDIQSYDQYKKSITDEIKLLQDKQSLISSSSSLESKAIQNQIDLLQAKLKYENDKNAIQSKIDANEATIKALENQKDAQDEVNTRLEKQTELTKLQTELENIRNQKNIQTLTQKSDGSWDFEYTFDKSAYTSKQEEVKSAQKELSEWESDLAIEKATKALETQNDGYEKEIKLLEYKWEQYKETNSKAYDEITEQISTAYDVINQNIELKYIDLNTKLEARYKDMNSLVDTNLKTLKDTFGTNFDEINKALASDIIGINDKVTEAVTALAKLNAMKTSIGIASATTGDTSVKTNVNVQVDYKGMSDDEFRVASIKNLLGFDTGGYTENGGVALLHDKELVLNKVDTSNLLKVVDMTRNLMSTFGLIKTPQLNNNSGNGTVIRECTLSFPNINDNSTVKNITDIFNSLPRVALQN